MNSGLSAFATFLVNRVLKLDFLSGYTMYLAGFGTILGGIVSGINAVLDGDVTQEEIAIAWAAIALGVTVIGAARKGDKIIAAQSGPTVVVPATEEEAPAIAEDIAEAAKEVDRVE